MYSQ
jgi:hypothetical protein